MSPSNLLSMAIAALLFVAFILRQLSATRNSLEAGASSMDKIKKCVDIIAAKVTPDGRANLLSQLQSRAISNSRLASGFGIDNAFTTTDETQAREFVRQAQTYMNVVKWEELGVLASKDVQSFLATCPQDAVPLASLVQTVSLSMALRVFIKDDTAPANLVQSRLLVISDFINKIWIDSKLPGHKVAYEERHELHDALRAVCPGLDPLNPQQNPLNWLLPSFETLWRIALRTCIEVKFSKHTHPEWSRALIRFARNPTKKQFEELFESQSVHHQGQTKISAQNIINEALRLHLPTRHVHRAFQLDKDGWSGPCPLVTAIVTAVSWLKASLGSVGHMHSDVPQVMIADIESLHVNKDMWGADALKFDPERWNKVSDFQKKAFMPFGGKPFLCPAKPVFGPRVIALVVGVLLAVFDGDDWGMDCNDSLIMKELNTGTRLSSRRDKYTDVVLRRRVR